MTPQELRSSMIRLAMRGKLVPQIDMEGSGQELYERINAEKKRLGVKISKKTEPVTEEAIPFDIPTNWCWVRFGSIAAYNMGKTPPRAESEWWENEFPWVSIADMPENGHISATKEGVSKSAISSKFNNKISKAGTMIMSFKLTIGRVSILDIDAVHNEAIISIHPYCDTDRIIQSYLFYLLPTVTQFSDSKNAMKGKTLNDTSIRNLLIPLPPLAEQKRIVAKIKELLPFIDRYEQAWNCLEKFNKQFPIDMQNSLLQLAIQGKLVEQRSEEGAAEELYQQIQAKKRRLVKEGRIKKEKPLPEIAEGEAPFDIPASWKWVRLSSIMTLENGDRSTKYPTEKDYVDFGIPFFGAKDMVNQYMSFDHVRYISQSKFDELGNGKLQNNDFICLLRGSVGKTAVFKADENHQTGFVCAQMIILRAIIPELLLYLHCFMNSPCYSSAVKDKTTGTAVRQLPAKELARILVPLPPLAEQKRIVAKLEELLPLCEKLKRSF